MEGYTPVTASFRSHRGIVCHVYCTYEGHILYDLWHMQPPYGLSALLNITSIWCSETAVHTDLSEKKFYEVTQAHILLCLWVLCLLLYSNINKMHYKYIQHFYGLFKVQLFISQPFAICYTLPFKSWGWLDFCFFVLFWKSLLCWPKLHLFDQTYSKKK